MCKTRDGGAACGRDKVCPFFVNKKDMKKTKQERLEDKCCMKRNRWVKKKKLQGRNKSSHDTAFGLANTLRMM